jgi:hypothetical protein
MGWVFLLNPNFLSMGKLASLLFIVSFLFFSSINAQNTRISNTNSIGWYNYFGTFKVSKKFGIHTEYQFRRNEVITERQQSLLRLGVNYQLNSKIQTCFP